MNKTRILKGTCTFHVKACDWGAVTNQLLIHFERPVLNADAGDFQVLETQERFESPNQLQISSLERTVTQAILCDAKGNPVSGPGEYVMLKLYVSPDEGSAVCFDPNIGRTLWPKTCMFAISLTPRHVLQVLGKDGRIEIIDSLMVDPKPAGKTSDADGFHTGSFAASDGVEYNYAWYQPEHPSKTLLVWLHGGGEGMADQSDVSIPVLMAAVPAFAEEAFQSTLGGAWILVPAVSDDLDGQRKAHQKLG